ncbi:MAG: hypothetical protein AMXMBFR13_04950 [Phycisphaerae bacterium]
MDLLKAEAALLRRGLVAVWMDLVLIAVAGLLLFAALLMMAWGLYLVIRSTLGPSGAALLGGAMGVALAGGMLWVLRRTPR